MYNIGVFFFNYFIAFLTMIVLFITFFQLAKIEKVKSKSFLGMIIIYSLVELFISYFAPAYINGMICFSFFIIVEKIYTKIKVSEIIFYNVIIWLILFLLDMIIMLIFKVANLFIVIDPLIIKPIGTIIMIFFLVWLTRLKFIIKNIYKIKNYIFSLRISSINLIILVIIFILYCSLDAYIFIKIENKGIVEITVLLSIISIISLGKLIFNMVDLYSLKKTNQLLIKNNEFYIKLVDDYRIFKHNLTSKLLGIKAISNKDAKKVINDLIKEYNKSFKTTFDIKDAPTGINGLIYEKIYNFNNNDLNISIINKVEKDILSIISPRSYNLLCESLGIILDNALDAASKSNEKVVYLQFTEEDKYLLIKVMNTFEGEIEIEKIGKLNYTTKEEGHGLGLYSLINRRKISLKTSIKNNVFINQIKVTKK